MITTVAFDLDDTLYDEINYCKSGFAAAADFAAKLPDAPAAERIFDEFWQQFTNGDRTRVFNAAFDSLGIRCDNKLIGDMVKVYRNHRPKITLPDDTGKILEQLNGKYTLALLTDGFLPAQKLKVRSLGIEKYFKCIIYTEMLGRDCWKPSPVGFEKLLHDLNIKAENTVYVADNAQKDFIAPNKLGIKTIQIIRPSGLHTEFPSQPDDAPDYVIHGIGELSDLLIKL